MKTSFKLMAALAVACAMVSCTKPNDDPKPGPDEKAPVANFTFSANALTVSFTNTSENATSYKWEFGDGETSKEASPKHEYASAGTYTVKLTAANASGVTAKKEASVTVAGAAKAYFSSESVEGRAGKFGLVLKFDATASANAESIEWNFGDGTTDNQFTVNHEFPAYGSYEVSATVTGLGGDKDTYKTTVEAIAMNELLKGGDMEEDDAKYWTYWSTEVFPEGDYETPTPDVLSWVPTFGYKEDGPKAGQGGCLRLSSENQIHDQANNMRIWQAIEVEEGDRLELSAQMKWGENSNDCGLLWFGIAYAEDEIGMDGTSVVEMFNYWSAAGTNPVPAFDGGFEANAEYIAANETLELGYSNAGEAVGVHYAQKSGTVYFYVDYRSVWGPFFGPGINIYFDKLSCKITFEE